MECAASRNKKTCNNTICYLPLTKNKHFSDNTHHSKILIIDQNAEMDFQFSV